MARAKYKPKFFPFSAGIPWKVERGKYIVPKIDSETWHRVLDGRDVIITAFGGAFESFFSLTAAEALVSFDPKRKVFWLGNDNYTSFVRAQGLCKSCTINLTPELLRSYPTPIFFDQADNAYFNILNNYLIREAYWGKHPEKVTAPVVKQIYDNVMMPWRGYIPKLRKLGSEFLDEMTRTGRIRPRSRIVLIVLDETKEDLLGWTIQNLKEFAQLAASKGLRVVLFTKNTGLFYGSNLIVCEYDLRNILQIMNSSWMVMSTSIDWLLISLMISDARIISRHIEGPFDLFKNAEFLQVQNDIFTDQNWVSPIDAFTICEGLL